MLDLGRLRVLHAVHVHGSVRGAASALGYTPSAVSQQLSKLERETHTTLLERQGRGVVLTKAARTLVDVAEKMLALVDLAESELSRDADTAPQELSIAAFPTAARGLLPGVLCALKPSHPTLDLRIIEADPRFAVTMVSDGGADLAIAHDWENSAFSPPKETSWKVISYDPADVVMAADHPMARQQSVSRRDLIDARWIAQPPGTACHDMLLRIMRDIGAEPEVAHYIAEFPTQIALASIGQGIALVPRLGRGPLPAAVVARPLRPAIFRRVYALWRTRTGLRPVIDQAVGILLKHEEAGVSASSAPGCSGEMPPPPHRSAHNAGTCEAAR